MFLNNCYWVYNLETAAQIADIIDESDVADSYRKQADEVRSAIHHEFYDPQIRGYVTNLQATLAIALLVDIPPTELRETIEQTFEKEILVNRDGHFWGGITGGYFIFKQLLKSGRNDLAYEMVSKRDYPSWGDMLHQGATTVWENWEGDNSRLHSSLLHVGAWLMEGLAAIVPDPAQPGYKHFFARPGIVDNEELKRG